MYKPINYCLLWPRNFVKHIASRPSIQAQMKLAVWIPESVASEGVWHCWQRSGHVLFEPNASNLFTYQVDKEKWKHLTTNLPPSTVQCLNCSGLNCFAHSLPDVLECIISFHFHFFPGAGFTLYLLDYFNSQP